VAHDLHLCGEGFVGIVSQGRGLKGMGGGKSARKRENIKESKIKRSMNVQVTGAGHGTSWQG